MTLEIRATDNPQHFDLFDATGRLGEIAYVPETEPDAWGGVDPACWRTTLWSMTGSGKEWGDEAPTLEEAKEIAHTEYPELVAERREANKPGPGPRPTTVSTPMGGQRRR